MTHVVSIDIGGTKLAAGVVGDDGTLAAHAKVPTPATGDADAVFAALESILDPLGAAVHDAVAVGVGCGGPMTRGGETVSPLNIHAWRDFPLRARLTERFPGLPVFVDNDAKALALGEGWTGAARDCGDYIGMVVSTGVGGGIVSGGVLLDGAQGNAGHVGHVIVEPEGHICNCGARGCLEAEASGSAIARITGKAPRDASTEIRMRAGTMVGRAIASAANLLDLRLAVISGSVALGYGQPFFDAAQSEIDARARLDFSRGARAVPGALGPDGPLIGAARVALHQLA